MNRKARRLLRVERLEDRRMLSCVPGDFDASDTVDAADYTVWRDDLGSETALVNDDGLGTPIGQAHYELWKANFGRLVERRLSINDVTMSNESVASATFTVTLCAMWDQTVTVDYATSNGTATAGEDYTATSGTLTFAPGDTTKTFTVAVLADSIDEANETATITLSNASNASISDATGTLTITDDDDPPSLSIDDVTVDPESDTNATFTVILSAASGKTVTVDYATSNGTATAGTDYTATSGTLTFAPCDTTKTFTVAVLADSTDEANETATITFSNASNASISDATGTLTIIDDDDPPSLSIDDVTVDPESETNATLTVTLSAASGQDVTVNYATSNGTATAGVDYTEESGDLTIPAGETTKTFTVDVTPPPSLSIDDVTVDPESDTNATFTVTLSAASGQTVTVDYASSDGNATAGADYTATNGTLTFSAYETSGEITVPVLADSLNEANETVTLTLSNASNASISDSKGTLTITDDDMRGSGPRVFPATNIATSADGAFAVHVADMDGDGDLDIVSASPGDDTIAWYENDGASEPTWTPEDIVPLYDEFGELIFSADQARGVYVADLDGDGDLDIVSASTADKMIAWYENDGEADPSWNAAVITTDVIGAWEIDVGDMDGDGDLDISYAAFGGNRIGWIENDGAADPGWTKADIATGLNKPVDAKLADLDGDGDLDIVAAIWSGNTVTWYEHDGNNDDPTWTEASTAMSTNVDAPHAVKIADMDGDGDLDVVSASYGDDKIAWFENDGAEDPSFTAETIATSADGARDVYLADLDGDGHMDIISASEIDDTVAWYKNDGASNPTWTARDIAYSADMAAAVSVGDLDGDGDLDIVSGSRRDNTIAWYENTPCENEVSGNFNIFCSNLNYPRVSAYTTPIQKGQAIIYNPYDNFGNWFYVMDSAISGDVGESLREEVHDYGITWCCGGQDDHDGNTTSSRALFKHRGIETKKGPADETVKITLSNASNATIADADGTLTIKTGDEIGANSLASGIHSRDATWLYDYDGYLKLYHPENGQHHVRAISTVKVPGDYLYFGFANKNNTARTPPTEITFETAPTVTNYSPADGQPFVAVDANITLTFSEDVTVYMGNITIKKASDNSVFEAIDVTSDQVTGAESNTITINPSSNFAFGTEYYVEINQNAFDDAAGVSYEGIRDATTFNFTTAD